MTLKILMYYPGRIDQVPPALTAAVCMARCGAEVHVLAFGAAPPVAHYLRSHAVDLVALRQRHPTTYLGKVVLWLQGVLRLLRAKWALAPHCLWYHQSNFPVWYALLPGINRGALVVAHSHEMTNDRRLRWMTQKALARRADLVLVPEANRAVILQQFSRSSARFVLVPNRPLDQAMPPADAAPRAVSIFQQHGGSPECSRFLVYQGVFMPGRCLEELISGFKKIPFRDAGLILLGADPGSPMHQQLANLAADDRRIVILPRIPPPEHLQITRGCVGGILLYAPTCLNNIYCAPNKIYEYALFGLGMVLPDSPGLTPIVQQYQLGALCNPVDPDSIAKAMTTVLERNPEQYQQACARFLASGVSAEEAFRNIEAMLAAMVRERGVRRYRSQNVVARLWRRFWRWDGLGRQGT